MVAERAIELPFAPESAQGQAALPLEIPVHSQQPTELYRGKVDVSRHVSAHYSLRMPLDYVSSDLIDLHLNGITAPGEFYDPVRDAGVQLGKMGVTLGAMPGLPWLGILSPRQLRNSEQYRKEAVLATIEDIQENFGTDLRFRAKGHSTGARTATAVAEDAPELIDSVTLVHAAGLVDGQNTINFAGRLKDFWNDEMVPNLDIMQHHYGNPRALSRFFWYNLGNPVRTGIEAFSISNEDIRDRVVNLGSLGVKVAILDGLGDRLTPNTSVEGDIGDSIDYYRMHPGFIHLSPQVHDVATAMEYHAIDRILHPAEVLPARLFSVQAMRRSVNVRRMSVPQLAEAS